MDTTEVAMEKVNVGVDTLTKTAASSPYIKDNFERIFDTTSAISKIFLSIILRLSPLRE